MRRLPPQIHPIPWALTAHEPWHAGIEVTWPSVRREAPDAAAAKPPQIGCRAIVGEVRSAARQHRRSARSAAARGAHPAPPSRCGVRGSGV